MYAKTLYTFKQSTSVPGLIESIDPCTINLEGEIRQESLGKTISEHLGSSSKVDIETILLSESWFLPFNLLQIPMYFI